MWANFANSTNQMAAEVAAGASVLAKEVNEVFDNMVAQYNEEGGENVGEENKEGEEKKEGEEEEGPGIGEKVNEISEQVAEFFVGAGEVVGGAVTKLVDDAGEALQGMQGGEGGGRGGGGGVGGVGCEA